jgi:hypothetical protein
MSIGKTRKPSVFISRFYILATVVIALYAIAIGINKGIASGSKSGLIAWVSFGLAGAAIVVFTLFATDFGIKVWGESIDRLIKLIRKYPTFRFWTTSPGVLFSLIAGILVLKYPGIELSLRILISLYLIFILPAAIISLGRDDLGKEYSKLAKIISRETRIHNPQTAIAGAFIQLEDRLWKRLSKDPKLYGERLIRAAYEGEKSKLIYKSDGKDYTEPLYNLMSGTYSIFRNPRQHIIINDDEQKAQALISLVELLIEFVDKSGVTAVKRGQLAHL